MGLMNELGITGPVDAGEVESRAAAGGLAPEGIHHAVLNAAGAKVINGEKRGYELTFRLLAGPGAGQEVKEIVWLPKGEDEKKDQRMKDRLFLFAAKLGLLKKERKNGKDVYTEVEGKHDFADCLGAECFVEVQHEEREYEKDGKKKHIKEARLSYHPGLFAANDPTCTKIPRGSAAAVSAAVAAGGVGAGAGGAGGKKDDYSDL